MTSLIRNKPKNMKPEPGQEGKSFKTLLLEAVPSLRAFALSLTGTSDRADDLVQETLVKAWDKQDTFQLGSNINAWLFTILRNEFYSQMRKKGREVSDSDGIFASKLASHPEQEGKLDMQDFREALAQLPEDQREALILVGATGLSYEEAAEVCGVAVGTVKSRVSRARTQLGEILSVNNASEWGPDDISSQVLNPPGGFAPKN
jgi:RNA polymerase sigma-70 factor (ECF subfamily)